MNRKNFLNKKNKIRDIEEIYQEGGEEYIKRILDHSAKLDRRTYIDAVKLIKDFEYLKEILITSGRDYFIFRKTLIHMINTDVKKSILFIKEYYEEISSTKKTLILIEEFERYSLGKEMVIKNKILDLIKKIKKRIKLYTSMSIMELKSYVRG